MILQNAISHYYPEIQHALRLLAEAAGPDDEETFTPGWRLPELTPPVREYLSTSSLAYAPMTAYRGRRLSLLDLTRNPATGTTKTFASLVIVARAVRFIQDTGQRVTIVTPSSANKAVALRDAVLRAVHCGLVGPDQLNIVAIVPAGSAHKLRDSQLSADPDLRRRNPVAVYDGSEPGQVKAIAQHAVENYRSLLEGKLKTNIWYTLRLDNYLGADVVRAYAENDFFPPGQDQSRAHAHAVSSAYGLLGHAYGRELLGRSVSPLAPEYLLVQHLGAPDMVLSLYRDQPHGFDSPPHYIYDGVLGVYRQNENPHFPLVTFVPDEVLDPTFYTRNPPTTTRMTELIRTQGGGGVVVSLAECLARFGEVRSLLSEAGVPVPANPTLVQEWSLVMALTGVLNAIDRDIVKADDIVVHGSGTYSRTEFSPIGVRDLCRADTVDALRDLIAHSSAL
jgi:hypothetical protein